MANLSELRLRVRLKVDDNETVKAFNDAFYDDEIRAAVKQHNSDYEVVTLPDNEEHLVIWLTASQVCIARASKQASSKSYPTLQGGDIDDISLDGIGGKKADTGKSMDYWLKLAKVYQDSYDQEVGGKLGNIEMTQMRRLDRESQLQVPSSAYQLPTSVILQNPTKTTATTLRLHWTICDDRDFYAYKIYMSTGNEVDDDSTLVGTVTDRKKLYLDVDNLEPDTDYLTVVHTWNTSTTSTNKSFGISNEVIAPTDGGV